MLRELRVTPRLVAVSFRTNPQAFAIQLSYSSIMHPTPIVINLDRFSNMFSAGVRPPHFTSYDTSFWPLPAICRPSTFSISRPRLPFALAAGMYSAGVLRR